jgi:hypothetical protein
VVLEKNLKALDNKDSLVEDIASILNEKGERLLAQDGISQSRGRRYLARGVKFMMSGQNLAMGLARLDPHGVAPIVLGGVYTLVLILQNNSDESRAAMTIPLELAEMVALWNSTEKNQIMRNSNPTLKALFEKLSKSIKVLFEGIIALLGRMMVYFDRRRWCECI